MSEALSASVRFEDHFGPIVPDDVDPSTRRSSPHRQDVERRRDLVEHMRRCVVKATMAKDHATKVELWNSYRAARTEAVALAACPMPDIADAPLLRSV